MFLRQSQIKSSLPRYRAILVASNHMHREFLLNGVSSERLHLVPLPAAGTELIPTSPSVKTRRDRILFIGRLMDLKGVEYLIKATVQAAKTLGRPLTLTIGGDGQERTKLEQLARALGVMAKFVGWVQTRQKADLMREADLLAVPSLWPEPFGLVGLEAGCLGVPSVAYSVGGIPDWLIPGQTGELAPGDPPTVDGLAAAIVRALADSSHYDHLAMGARNLAQRFTLKGHFASLERILGAECSPDTFQAVRSDPRPCQIQ